MPTRVRMCSQLVIKCEYCSANWNASKYNNWIRYKFIRNTGQYRRHPYTYTWEKFFNRQHINTSEVKSAIPELEIRILSDLEELTRSLLNNDYNQDYPSNAVSFVLAKFLSGSRINSCEYSSRNVRWRDEGASFIDSEHFFKRWV